ncbi:MAG: formimidoylglutamate deiminase [Acidimicrobiia bacterium]|nr:formimidoylglutamate deiminase [Acidimicrobiia bacterium]
MGESGLWHADHAWLGDEDLAEGVLVAVEGGVISSVTTGAASGDARKLEGVLLPGLVSAHSHAFHRLLRGRTHSGRGDFWAWREAMYSTAEKLTPTSYRSLAVDVFTEMLQAGITTVGEFHYVHHQADGTPYDDPNAMGLALIEAADEVGIRMTLLDTAYLTSTVYGDPPTPQQARFSDGTIESWGSRVEGLHAVRHSQRVRIGVAAHSVRALSPADLEAVATLAAEHHLPLHIHASEQPAENEDCLRAHGVTPVGLLADVGFLGPRTTIVHGTHVSDEDIALVASAGAAVCFCPTTEADLGDGIGPAEEYSRAGVPISLGSDSNAVIDILAEAGRLESHDRLRLLRRGVHSPRSLMIAATEGGAANLGWETGRIASGFLADFVVLDSSSHELVGTPADLASIALHATRASVNKVIVGGQELDLPRPTYEKAK